MSKVEVEIEELKRVFLLMEEVHDLFHQPMYYEDEVRVKKFADQHYEEIRYLFYKVLWNWLPKRVQKEIEER